MNSGAMNGCCHYRRRFRSEVGHDERADGLGSPIPDPATKSLAGALVKAQSLDARRISRRQMTVSPCVLSIS